MSLKISPSFIGQIVIFATPFLPTISDYFYRKLGVRIDLTGEEKTSSTAKHCILLRLMEREKRFKKIPLPAPLKKGSIFLPL